jgi:hypothetical protein
VRAERFGLDLFDGYFGPLRLDNRPVPSNTWADFYAQRRVIPLLRAAVDSGNLPPGLTAKIETSLRATWRSYVKIVNPHLRNTAEASPGSQCHVAY